MAYLTVTFSLGYIRPTVVVTTHLEAHPVQPSYTSFLLTQRKTSNTNKTPFWWRLGPCVKNKIHFKQTQTGTAGSTPARTCTVRGRKYSPLKSSELRIIFSTLVRFLVQEMLHQYKSTFATEEIVVLITHLPVEALLCIFINKESLFI